MLYAEHAETQAAESTARLPIRRSGRRPTYLERQKEIPLGWRRCSSKTDPDCPRETQDSRRGSPGQTGRQASRQAHADKTCDDVGFPVYTAGRSRLFSRLPVQRPTVCVCPYRERPEQPSSRICPWSLVVSFLCGQGSAGRPFAIFFPFAVEPGVRGTKTPPRGGIVGELRGGFVSKWMSITSKHNDSVLMRLKRRACSWLGS